MWVQKLIDTSRGNPNVRHSLLTFGGTFGSRFTKKFLWRLTLSAMVRFERFRDHSWVDGRKFTLHVFLYTLNFSISQRQISSIGDCMTEFPGFLRHLFNAFERVEQPQGGHFHRLTEIINIVRILVRKKHPKNVLPTVFAKLLDLKTFGHQFFNIPRNHCGFVFRDQFVCQFFGKSGPAKIPLDDNTPHFSPRSYSVNNPRSCLPRWSLIAKMILTITIVPEGCFKKTTRLLCGRGFSDQHEWLSSLFFGSARNNARTKNRGRTGVLYALGPGLDTASM